MQIGPYYKSAKYNYNVNEVEDEDEMEDDSGSFPTDSDLLLLRKNAQGEREAIAFYLTAASKTSGPLSELFIDTAHDEMKHFRNSMILLAKYDPVQAQAFSELGINLKGNAFRKNHSPSYCSQERLEIIDLLTKSITSELAAINMYQESYESACHDDVKLLFANNANDEKLHVAEFWKALMIFTKENTILS